MSIFLPSYPDDFWDRVAREVAQIIAPTIPAQTPTETPLGTSLETATEAGGVAPADVTLPPPVAPYDPFPKDGMTTGLWFGPRG